MWRCLKPIFGVSCHGFIHVRAYVYRALDKDVQYNYKWRGCDNISPCQCLEMDHAMLNM